MANIGMVEKRRDGSYLGALAMKSYAGRVLLQPAGPKPSDGAPDFRLYGEADRGGRFEMGAAWIKRRADGAGTYVSVKIDFPELPTVVYATLGVMAGQDDPDVFAVIWNRPAEARVGRADPFAGLAARGPDDGPADAAAETAADPFEGLDGEAAGGRTKARRNGAAAPATEAPAH